MDDHHLRDLVGRLLVIGFQGDAMSPALRDLLLEVRPGGIILFKRNVETPPAQIKKLIADCQDLARSEFGRSLLVAIDQEGGPVKRLGLPFAQLPSQRSLGRSDPEQVARYGRTSGRELAQLGINLNLAPVLDVCTDPEAVFMRERSFGSDPEITSALSAAVIRGHHEEGVMTCAKHFPGIGDTRLDPHEDLPTLHYSRQRIKSVELTPFIRAVEEGVDGVMTAHVNFPSLDPDHPGTFSERILTGLLRGELGFRGLVITDDMEMGAVVRYRDIGRAVVRTIRAGSDVALICHRRDRILPARDALVGAVNTGEISLKRIEQSAERIDLALNNPAGGPGGKEDRGTYGKAASHIPV